MHQFPTHNSSCRTMSPLEKIATSATMLLTPTETGAAVGCWWSSRYLMWPVTPELNMTLKLCGSRSTPHPKAEWVYSACYRPEVDDLTLLTCIKQSTNHIGIENTVLLIDFNYRLARLNMHQDNRAEVNRNHKQCPPGPNSHRVQYRVKTS